MLLPASREQINKLGVRLASDGPISNDDFHALEELTACHLTALEMARPRIDSAAATAVTVPLHITHRAKTTQTIIEKLRREHGMALARMQDLAGIRIVGAIRFDEQDRLAVEIARLFPADPREPRTVDRRARPSHGYRAVHVIVSLDGVSIEVQVRTLFQHIWADLMERMADRLGRQIRYGEPPVPPPGMTVEAAQTFIAAMMTISESWAVDSEPTLDAPSARTQPLRIDQIAEGVWKAIASPLRQSGVDL